LIIGAAIGLNGQVTVINPQATNSACYRCLYPDTAEENACEESKEPIKSDGAKLGVDIYLLMLLLTPVYLFSKISNKFLGGCIAGYMIFSIVQTAFHYNVLFAGAYECKRKKTNSMRMFMNSIFYYFLSVVYFGYLYKLFYSDFQWIQSTKEKIAYIPNTFEAIFNSFATSLTLTMGEFKYINLTGQVIVFAQLIVTFLLVAIIISASHYDPNKELNHKRHNE